REAQPWSDELDRDAFRFPRGYEAKRAQRRVARTVAEGMAAPPAATSETRVPDGGRRTVTIRGRGAERDLPVARPTLRRHERPGFKADRAALWAVMLGLVLILVAAASAHAAILH